MTTGQGGVERVAAYDPEVTPAKAEALAEKGLTPVQIAKRLKVSRATVVRWKAEHPEFRAALEAGWEAGTDLIVHALYKLATGFSYTETKGTPAEKNPSAASTDEAGKRPRRAGARTRKYVPPEYRAIVLWLSRRRPREWGEGAAEGGLAQDAPELPNVSIEELLEAIRKLSG